MKNLDPDFAWGRIQLGEALLMAGEQNNAIAEFSVALAQLSKSAIQERANVYYHLSVAYRQTEQWDLARKALQRARSLNPDLAVDR